MCEGVREEDISADLMQGCERAVVAEIFSSVCAEVRDEVCVCVCERFIQDFDNLVLENGLDAWDRVWRHSNGSISVKYEQLKPEKIPRSL